MTDNFSLSAILKLWHKNYGLVKEDSSYNLNKKNIKKGKKNGKRRRVRGVGA